MVKALSDCNGWGIRPVWQWGVNGWVVVVVVAGSPAIMGTLPTGWQWLLITPDPTLYRGRLVEVGDVVVRGQVLRIH